MVDNDWSEASARVVFCVALRIPKVAAMPDSRSSNNMPLLKDSALSYCPKPTQCNAIARIYTESCSRDGQSLPKL